MASQPSEENLKGNHDAAIITVVVVFASLSVTATILRIISRRMKKVKLQVDDYMLFFALILSMVQSFHVVAGLNAYGLGRHVATLNQTQIENFGKLYYEVGLFQPTILSLAKVSVLILFHRIFITPKFRLAVWIVGAVVITWWFAAFFAQALLCIPVEKNWDPSVRGHCGNSKLLELTSPVPWIATDLAVLILPLPIIYSLHMPRNQRIALGGLFFLGSFSLISSCIRYSCVFYSNDDFSWNIVPTAIWTLIEAYVAVISASLIVIKPVYMILYPEKLVSRLETNLQRKKSKPHSDSSSRLQESRPGFSGPPQESRKESDGSTTNEEGKDLPLQEIMVRQDWLVSSTPREVV